MDPVAEQVQRRLRDQGASGDVLELPVSTHTAAEAAAALGVEVAQIAKSLVFAAGDEEVLVVASGADRVDTARLAGHVGAPVGPADPDRVRRATGYAVGGVTPIGLPGGLRVLVDRALAAHDVVWAAAGTPSSVFPTTYAELLRLTGGEPADVRKR